MKSAGYDPVHTPGKPMFVHRRPVARALSVVQSVVIIIYSTFLFAWILGTFLKKQAGVAFNAIVCSIFAMIIFFSLLGLYGTGYIYQILLNNFIYYFIKFQLWWTQKIGEAEIPSNSFHISSHLWNFPSYLKFLIISIPCVWEVLLSCILQTSFQIIRRFY